METMISLLLLLLGCLSIFVQAQDKVKLKVGVILPFGRADSNYNTTAIMTYHLARLAFKDAENSFLPMANFTVKIYDTYSGLEDPTTDSREAIFRAIDAVQDG